jgi:hypothetical protein
VKDDLPDITKLAARVVAAIETAVTRFPRKFRYSAGGDLRAASRHVVRCAHAAWYARQRKAQLVFDLSRAVDDLKIEINIADLVKAWGSVEELEAIGRLVRDLGQQVGGWQRKLHSKGQNGAAERQPQRAQILSSRDASASAGAHP